MKRFFKHKIYRTSPVWGQNAFITLKAFVYNKCRKNKHSLPLLKELESNESLTYEILQQIQLQKLRNIVMIAGKKIPWYRNIFKDIGFDPCSPFTLEEFSKLPLLRKADILENYNQFLPDHDKRLLSIRTQSSGTTGNSLYIQRDRTAIGGEWAFSQRQFRWAGIPFDGRIAYLRDDEIVPQCKKKPPFTRASWLNDELWASSFHLSEATVEPYFDALHRFKPAGIFSYPSTIYWLSVFALNKGINAIIPSLKGIVVSSEMLYDFQIKSITAAFNVPVFNWYGSVERVNFIGTCEMGSMHIFPDYGFNEYLPINDSTNQFELVGTGFLNTAMPLLRYCSGDIIEKSGKHCLCGRHFPVINTIYGRCNDAIVTPDGRRITILEIFDEITSINQIQIIQVSPNELVIKVTPKPTFCEHDKEIILYNLQTIVGPEMKLSFTFDDNIIGGPLGKYRMIISKI